MKTAGKNRIDLTSTRRPDARPTRSGKKTSVRPLLVEAGSVRSFWRSLQQAPLWQRWPVRWRRAGRPSCGHGIEQCLRHEAGFVTPKPREEIVVQKLRVG